MINCFNNVVPKRKQACMENIVNLIKPLSTEVSQNGKLWWRFSLNCTHERVAACNRLASTLIEP